MIFLTHLCFRCESLVFLWLGFVSPKESPSLFPSFCVSISFSLLIRAPHRKTTRPPLLTWICILPPSIPFSRLFEFFLLSASRIFCFLIAFSQHLYEFSCFLFPHRNTPPFFSFLLPSSVLLSSMAYPTAAQKKSSFLVFFFLSLVSLCLQSHPALCLVFPFIFAFPLWVKVPQCTQSLAPPLRSDPLSSCLI